MPTSGTSRKLDRRTSGRLAILLGVAGTVGLLVALTGCGPLLQTIAEKITGIPLAGFPTPTQIPTTASPTTVPSTPTVAPTTSASASPTVPSVLYNATVTGSTSVIVAATYPTSFFSNNSYNGDITNSSTGEGTITPNSIINPVKVTVTSSNTASRPQIQFQDNITTTTIFTNPQNTTTNVLSTSFTPISTSTLRFSVIDTGVAATGNSYVILIQQ